MNLTIDTINKTITVNATVNITEFLDSLISLNINLEEYSITSNPIMYYPTIPYYGPVPTYDPNPNLNPIFCTTAR